MDKKIPEEQANLNQPQELSGDEVALGNTGRIELPKFDATRYIGKKVQVIRVSEHKKEFKNKTSYYVKFTTVEVELGIAATKIIGLQIDEDNNIGWGEGTKMDDFLKKYSIDHYKDMLGKEVIIQTITKEGKDYLTF